jgi:hypothetical protein
MFHLGLLVNFECIENLVFDRRCKIAGIEKNVWNKILRLEMDNSICRCEHATALKYGLI